MKYITFLGLGGREGYSELLTYFEGEEETENISCTRLVQEHIYNSFKDQIDAVYVFLTKESKEKYLEDLSAIVTDHEIQEILIDQNISSEQFVNHLIHILDFNDEVILDVTHSFRKIPIRLLFALRYIEAMNQVKIRHIFYGEVEKPNTENTYSVIHDLVNDYQMQKVAEYLSQFDRTLIIRKEDWADLTSVDSTIEKLLKDLASFNDMTELCDLDSACSSVYRIVKSALNIEEKALSASGKNPYVLLVPLARKIRQKFEIIQNKTSEKDKLVEIIRILLDHERYQLATTFTDELFNRELIRSITIPDSTRYDQSFVLRKNDLHLPKSFTDNFSYKLSQYLKMKTGLRKNASLRPDDEKVLEKSLPLKGENFDRIQKICQSNSKDINNFSSKIRNSMNHASGLSHNPSDQKKQLKEQITKMTNIIVKF